MEKEKKNFYTLCPNCFSYPCISFSTDNIEKIFIQCNYCKYNDNYSIHSYLNLMQERNLKIPEDPEGNQIYPFFCSKCSMYLKENFNKDIHKSHTIINLSEPISIDVLKDKIKEGYNHINNYCYELKVSKIKELSNSINQIEYSFLSFKSLNTNILQLLESMISNYELKNHNYYLRNNINKLKEIYIYKCPNYNDVDGIIHYYNNYSFLHDLPVDISTFKNKSTITGHKMSVWCVMLLKDGRLASCSSDKTIKIFNLNNQQCDVTITGHSYSISSITQLSNGKLISASWDKSIKIWTIFKTTYKLDYTIEQAHLNWIRKVISLSNNRIASCSLDTFIKIWSSNPPYNIIQTLKGHSKGVNSIIQLKEKEILISGSFWDNILCLWSLVSYQLMTIINEVQCFNNNCLVELNNNTIISGGDQLITIVDINKCKIENKIKNAQLGYVWSFMILRDYKILCGCTDGIMGIYDTTNNTLIFDDKRMHKRSISGLIQIDPHQLISCSEDNNIKVWEY